MTFHRIIRPAKRHQDLKFLSEKKNLVMLSQLKNLLCLNRLPVFLLRLFFFFFITNSGTKGETQFKEINFGQVTAIKREKRSLISLRDKQTNTPQRTSRLVNMEGCRDT